MKKTILKIFAVVCVLCLMLAIAGCSAKQTQVGSTTASTNSETTQTIETTVSDENTATQNTEETVATEEETKPAVEEQKTDKEETKPVVNEQKPNKEEEKPNNNTAEQEQAEKDAALTNAKALAKNALDTYVTASSYREAQKTALATAIANGKTAIDAAADSAAVDAAVAAAKTAIDAIPTDAELTAEENAAAAQALAAAKTNAKTALDAYVDADDYREAQQTELATAIANGKTAIDAAADSAAVDAAVAATKTVIDAIPTDAELTTEENATAQALATAKANAKSALDAYVDADDYREAQQTELATAIANGKTAIDAATDAAGVDSALAAAKAEIDAIETDAEITAKSPVIYGVLTDGMVVTNNRGTLDVYAKTANGVKLSCSKVTVTVNGDPVSVNWDDEIKTSYNFVFEEGENTVVVTAQDGNYITTETYTVICNMDKPTTITVSIEAFSVGLGYLVEPYKLVLDEATLTDMADMYGYADAEEIKEKLSMAHCLDYALQTHGMSMLYSGSLESTWNGFYMSSISGVDTSYIEVPAELQEALEMNGYSVDPCVYEEGTLAEFDVTWGAGWMYMVNNSFPNVPFCDYVPQDGDVMRVQFTLAYGSDLGDWGIMGEPFFENVDRDELTELIADAAAAGVDYSEAFTVVSSFGISQDELDEASRKLREELSE